MHASGMGSPRRLVTKKLRRICSPGSLRFKTTEKLRPCDGCVAQSRVKNAFGYALKNRHAGYNIFAMGSRDLEIGIAVTELVGAEAEERPVRPSDWIYVHNFEDARRPLAIRLPVGRGKVFRADMQNFIENLASAIPAALDSDECRARLEELESRFGRPHEEALEQLRQEVEGADFVMIHTPGGITIAPAKDGKVLDQEDLSSMSKEDLMVIQEKLEGYQKELETIVQQVPRWRRGFLQSLKALNRDVAQNTVGQYITELLESYIDLPQIIAHIESLAADLLENIHLFADLHKELPEPVPGMQLPGPAEEGDPFLPYRVNLFVDNAGAETAPIIQEDNPSFVNLNGRIEHASEMGMLSTDFTMMKAGALHRANGGYLILDVRSVLLEPYGWESLKRALKSGSLRLESLGQAYGLVSTVTLEPEPIPLDVKVILVGERSLYYLLKQRDPEFSGLFRVAADFEEDLDWTAPNQRIFVRRLASLLERDRLLPLDAGATARVLEECARHSGDPGKLSLHSETISTLLHEADFLAREGGRGLVSLPEVLKALERRDERHWRIPELLYDKIEEETVLVDTEGTVIGQINGLSILSLGDAAFGQPNRITATARAGNGGIVDIEREVDLGGALHSKGVMILTGYLLGQFLPDERLSLSARLVFEQSYGGVDGDSASSAELYLLLSAIGKIPLRQDLAVTGSLNQHGEVQAIGGVNEKIEGFYEVCRRKGLTGTQGVLIPEANVKHLMLRSEVVSACDRCEFHIYPVRRVEQGIELLTGLAAGKRGKTGKFPAETVFGKVEGVLQSYARLLHPSDSKREVDEGDGNDEGEGRRKGKRS